MLDVRHGREQPDNAERDAERFPWGESTLELLLIAKSGEHNLVLSFD